MNIHADFDTVVEALHRLQERFEALAVENENLKSESLLNLQYATQPEHAGMASDEEVQAHIQRCLEWGKKSPIAILKAIWYGIKIKRLHLFDFTWYQKQYSDIGTSGNHPFRHYLRFGIFEGRNPSAKFDTWFYLKNHLPCLDPYEPAIIHYVRTGKRIGFTTAPRRNSESNYPDAIIAASERILKNLLTEGNDWQSLKQEISGLNKKLHHEIDQKKKSEHDLRKLILNEIRQLQSQISIIDYFNSDRVPTAYRGWPVSPDISLILINTIIEKDYDLLIEFGSGTSTVLMARTLRKKSEKSSKESIKVLSFEHLEEYWKKTRLMLEYEGLTHHATVQHSPLVSYTSDSGSSYIFYDCSQVLHREAERLHEAGLKVLVFVDGPPASTNSLARLPALEIVESVFPNAQIDILLDDYHRSDEKRIVTSWENYCKSRGRDFTISSPTAEKGVAVIKTTPPSWNQK